MTDNEGFELAQKLVKVAKIMEKAENCGEWPKKARNDPPKKQEMAQESFQKPPKCVHKILGNGEIHT